MPRNWLHQKPWQVAWSLGCAVTPD
jgi:hypothetical protein